MIELDIVTYLKNDATLANLLDSDVSDSRIYPIQSPHHVTTNVTVKNHILYNVTSEGTLEENMLEMTIQFNVRARDWSSVIAIAERLYTLLDRQYNIQNLVVSDDYYIYWAKIVGGTSFKEADQNAFTKGLNVEFKYNRKILP